MNRHIKALHAGLAVLVLIAFGMLSCELFEPEIGVEMKERVEKFEDALNKENRDDIYKQFHPDVEDRDKIKDDEVFDTGPLTYDYEPFEFKDIEVDEEKEEVTSEMHNDNGNVGTATFKMELDEEYDYYILEFKLETDSDDYTIKTLIQLPR